MPHFNRRELLKKTALIIAASGLSSCSSDLPSNPNDALNTLAGIAYDLFPFKELPPQLYADIASALVALNSDALVEGLGVVKQFTQGVAWVELEESRRIEILQQLEGSVFFAEVRAATIEALFVDPALWQLVGYGGSAIEHGGYLNRGFDDISWLPETN